VHHRKNLCEENFKNNIRYKKLGQIISELKRMNITS